MAPSQVARTVNVFSHARMKTSDVLRSAPCRLSRVLSAYTIGAVWQESSISCAKTGLRLQFSA